MGIKLRNPENKTGFLEGADIEADAVAGIAAKAAAEIDGVVALEDALTDGIAAALGRDGRVHGVRATQESDGCSFHIGVVTKYGEPIPEIAWNLQEHVKKTVENLAGVRVFKVNVLVAGIK